jgi:hypothetical protein
MFNESKNRLIFGVEPSPTPIVPIDSDSISVSETSLSFHLRRKRRRYHPTGRASTDDEYVLWYVC